MSYSSKKVGELREECEFRKIPECVSGGKLTKKELISLLKENDEKRKPKNYRSMRIAELKEECKSRGIERCLSNDYITRKDLIELLKENDNNKKEIVEMKEKPKLGYKPRVEEKIEIEEMTEKPKKGYGPKPRAIVRPVPGNDNNKMYKNNLIKSRLERKKEEDEEKRRQIIEKYKKELVEEKTINKKYKTRKFTLIEPIGINYFSTKNTEELIDDYSELKITLKEFIKLVENSNFIKKYIKSIKNFLIVKKDMYARRILEIMRENEKYKYEFIKLQEMGATEMMATIGKTFPQYKENAKFLVKLDNYFKKMEEKIENINETEVKKKLLEAINDPKRGINSIIGRDIIKNKIISLIYAFSKNYKSFIKSFNNMALMGPAGVGKTRLANVISFVLAKSGILLDDIVKVVSNSDLVAGHVGGTAIKTKTVLSSALEGVLFIDEAYQLGNEASKGDKSDFGKESITEIVNFLDKYIGMIIVIVAGYEGEMVRAFFPSNEGLIRRFPYRFILSPYNNCQLTDILIKNIEEQSDVEVGKEEGNFLYSMIVKLQLDHPDVFNNQAGDMLNLASSIVNSIYGSYRVNWETNNYQNNIPIVLEGFDEYLATKGLYRTKID